MNLVPHLRPLPHVAQDELQRQYRALRKDAPIRISTVTIAFLVAGAFLPWPFVALCFLFFFVGDLGTMALMRGLDPEKTPRRYWACMGCAQVTHLAYVLPAAVIWHSDVDYAKALAVGMVASRLTFLVSAAAIHRPLGLLGITVDFVVVLVSSTIYWINADNEAGLVLASTCIIAAFSYAAMALIANNTLHRETIAGRVEAQSANAAKSRFLAQMSHELRTPLNAILGMGHVELALSRNPQSRARLDVLVGAAANLGVILDDILDMSAIAEGAMPVRAIACDPVAEIESAVAIYRGLCAAKGLSLQVQVSAAVPRGASLDAQRMRQCLSNLLSNALKHTTHGGIALRVTFSDAALLDILISDTGNGVAESERDAIFQPFHRGLGDETGSGLGLAISQALARRMGGDLQLVPSTVGASFRLTLRLEVLASGATPLPPKPAESISMHGKQVLVVDDIASNRLVAATYLRLMGAGVIEADSGAAALRILQQQAVDLVLLDLNMPGMSGVEALTLIRQIDGNVALPVLAMTADAIAAHRQAYIAAGLDGYVTKPLTPASLVAAIAPHFPGATLHAAALGTS